MKTLICPTCGCSLVRLGISKENSVTYNYSGEEFYFCCQGCIDVFITDAEKYLQETEDLIVCSTCLAEKPRKWADKINIVNQEIFFCHCPHCVDVFKKEPDFYIKTLAGNIPNEGVLDHDGCCIRPDATRAEIKTCS